MLSNCPECQKLRIAVVDATDAATCTRTMGLAAELHLIKERSAEFFHGLEHVKASLCRQ
jgi:hypothetical protein